MHEQANARHRHNLHLHTLFIQLLLDVVEKAYLAAVGQQSYLRVGICGYNVSAMSHAFGNHIGLTRHIFYILTREHQNTRALVVLHGQFVALNTLCAEGRTKH